MKQILNEAKRKVIPTKKLENEKSQVAKIAFNSVEKHISKYPEVLQVEFGGSYAKGTWLPEKADIDIFIKFKKSTPEKKICYNCKKNWF